MENIQERRTGKKLTYWKPESMIVVLEKKMEWGKKIRRSSYG